MNTRHAPPSVGLRCLLAVVAGLVMLGLAPGASAQDLYSMADQLNQLQREVADLQRQVFAGGWASAGSAVGGGSVAAAGQEVRLQPQCRQQVEHAEIGRAGPKQQWQFVAKRPSSTSWPATSISG